MFVAYETIAKKTFYIHYWRGKLNEMVTSDIHSGGGGGMYSELVRSEVSMYSMRSSNSGLVRSNS